MYVTSKINDINKNDRHFCINKEKDIDEIDKDIKSLDDLIEISKLI